MLGAIADDVTGAVDLASNLVSRGFRTHLHFGVPETLPPAGYSSESADAIVVALKSRTAPVEDAVGQSLASLGALLAAGAERIYVKYCSTFDSTPRGNIGPVCDAVIERMSARTAVVVPSFPANGRTLYRGHLFVGDRLLSESSLAHHPLTPMTDPDIRRVLASQTAAQVGLLSLETVREGPGAVRAALDTFDEAGVRYVVVDAIDDHDLTTIATATATDAVITGGSGLALGMSGPSSHASLPAPTHLRSGPGVVLAGSASEATHIQLARAAAANVPILRLDLDALGEGVQRARAEAQARFATNPESVVIVAPAQSPGRVEATSPDGAARAAALEAAFADLARGLAGSGIRRFIVAGGETSGAVVDALGAHDLILGQTIDPGVAWTFTSGTGGRTPVALALKSGNFGGPDFFTDAWRRLT
ncbi:four-carbon acid sugar kinase family protein [Ruania alkalisoli]|uniref:3-oxo-tetronate kinase n=1 Tax=Ruania alkalisoli TaxID=2779775 RepID=A0A7M1STI5_9MICO|nr:3-oxo-tetronate kinase [Ruania alkalisoli]QOR70888.1 four-carbon acid sugar kinase family protein [Ruania alkalisoli]